MGVVPNAPTALIGTVLQGRYRVERALGEGAMGVVYLATDTRNGSSVALKTLQPVIFNEPKARERFQREATLASKIKHPAIAQILDFGVADDTPFLVMELVEGVELTEVIAQEGPMPPARAIAIMRPLIEGLAAAHASQLVHRDIKPQKIAPD